MIETKGLDKIRITLEVDTSSVRDGLRHTSSMVLDRKEVERKGNQKHGVENRLDPKWQDLSDEEFLNVALRTIEALASGPFIYPFEREDRSTFYQEISYPEGGALVLLPHHIRNIKIEGEYIEQ